MEKHSCRPIDNSQLTKTVLHSKFYGRSVMMRASKHQQSERFWRNLPPPETRSPPPGPGVGPRPWSPAYAPWSPADERGSRWRSGSTLARRSSSLSSSVVCFYRWNTGRMRVRPGPEKPWGGGAFLPPIRQEVHLDVRVPRSPVRSGGQVCGLEDIDDQLMTHLVVPELHLKRGEKRFVPAGRLTVLWWTTSWFHVLQRAVLAAPEEDPAGSQDWWGTSPI